MLDRKSAQRFPALAADEIQSHKLTDNFRNSKLTSVFFGGGTASLLTDQGVGAILDGLRQLSSGEQSISEVTLECEPGTIGKRRLENAKSAGVNRVSVCAQSFDDDELRRITRKHSSADSINLVHDCLSASINNIHIDLMYGLPGQTLESWTKSVQIATSLPVAHISLYKLFVFKHGKYDRNGIVPRHYLEPDDLTAKSKSFYDAGAAICEDAGFHQYSLTEFAKPFSKCEYIWQTFSGGDILPIGPSGFGRCGLELWENPTYTSIYGNASAWELRKRAHQLSIVESFKRDIILGLWLLSVDVLAVADRNGVTPTRDLLNLLEQLADQGHFQYTDGRILVGAGHRFDIGSAMEELSRFPSSSWAEATEGIPTGTPLEIDSPSDEQRSLNFILRTARRDPTFYSALHAEAEGAVSLVKSNLSASLGEELINAIRGGEAACADSHSKKLRTIWLDVVKEHEARTPTGSQDDR